MPRCGLPVFVADVIGPIRNRVQVVIANKRLHHDFGLLAQVILCDRGDDLVTFPAPAEAEIR